ADGDAASGRRAGPRVERRGGPGLAAAGFGTDRSRARLGLAVFLAQLLHVLVDEADHGGALADRGRAALDRAGADVARRVDAGDARLQQALGAGVVPGQDEALLGAGDLVAEPTGAGR